MKASEGKKVVIELNEYDVILLLKAVGRYQQVQWDNGSSTIYTEKLINKIYKAMGVKL